MATFRPDPPAARRCAHQERCTQPHVWSCLPTYHFTSGSKNPLPAIRRRRRTFTPTPAGGFVMNFWSCLKAATAGSMLAAAALSANAQSTFPLVPAQQCAKQFGQRVAACMRTNSTLPPAEREAANSACVDEARVAKETCETGPAACLANCSATYNSAAQVCETTYNVAQCGGVAECEAAVNEQRLICIGNAGRSYQRCTSICYGG